MVDGHRMSGEAELQVFEFAEAEVEYRRRAKPFLRWEWFAIGIAAPGSIRSGLGLHGVDELDDGLYRWHVAVGRIDHDRRRVKRDAIEWRVRAWLGREAVRSEVPKVVGRALEFPCVSKLRVHLAVDDADVGERCEPLEARSPESVLVCRLRDDRGPRTQQHFEDGEEGFERRDVQTGASIRGRVDHPFLDFVAANCGAANGPSKFVSQRCLTGARRTTHDDKGWKRHGGTVIERAARRGQG